MRLAGHGQRHHKLPVSKLVLLAKRYVELGRLEAMTEGCSEDDLRFWGFDHFELLLGRGDFLGCKNHTQPQDDINMTL